MFRLIVLLVLLLVGFAVADVLLDQLTGAHQSRLTQMEREVE